MASPASLGNVDWFSVVGQFAYWFKIVLYGIGFGVFAIISYVMLTYNIKAKVFKLYGSGKDGSFSFSKPTNNRFCWNKGKTAWKPLFPIFNKKEIEPFDQEYIYPGNNVYAFMLNQEYIPARININMTEDAIRAEVNPVPHYIRNWQSLTHKKHAAEYAEHTWWEDNKAMVYALLTGLIILIACCVTIYFTYKFAGGGRADIQALTNALKHFGDVPQKPM